MKTIINTDNAPKPVGPYSQAVKAGKFLFISGQLAIDPKEGKIIASDIKTQTARVMENIKAILEAADYRLKRRCPNQCLPLINDAFQRFQQHVRRSTLTRIIPARATVGVELMPGALVEISAVAYKE